MNGSYIAGGNISPRRIVKADADPREIIQATGATDRPVGIMQQGVRRAPGTDLDDGFAAIEGDTNFLVHGPLQDALVDVGSTAVSFDDYLTSDADGKATPASFSADTEQWIIARAKQDCASGGQCWVQVLSPFVKGAIS